ncbi:hypothetical protein ES319_A04G091000v1 [Gossypium barbadense]|uniref:Uncharacterized protein n=2 Tax=Gossypium TaxID=3633 RepID=A0A2P5YRT1_GOSBA|nr:hypothetical protein ES319_A04G091000v1 [Gossypium barbadense]PPS18306.1 hypothetical protein GOBAR_AA02269 [Gossypium barbadense]TYH22139.1 hypothetical protein ES288_A04G103100v1 [Gossypium darwinii]
MKLKLLAVFVGVMMVMSYSCMARPSRGMIGGIYRQEQGHHVAVEGRRNTVEKNIDNHHNIPIAVECYWEQ